MWFRGARRACPLRTESEIRQRPRDALHERLVKARPRMAAEQMRLDPGVLPQETVEPLEQCQDLLDRIVLRCRHRQCVERPVQHGAH